MDVRVMLVGGLPPLARGALALLPFGGAGRGPTPAGAGSTTLARCLTERPRAYPRWRGEHTSDAFEYLVVPGLPPLARGAPITLKS